MADCDAGTPGSLTQVQFIPETVWGETPGSPVRTFIAINDQTLQFNVQIRKSTGFVGTVDPVHARNSKGSVGGTVTTPLYPFQKASTTKSLAEYIMEWINPAAFGPALYCGMPSMTIEVKEGQDVSNRKFLGCRVSGFTISASENEPQLKAQINVIGKDMDDFATAASVPADLNELKDMDFSDIVLTVGGTTAKMKGFQLTVDYKMAGEFNNGRRLDTTVVNDYDIKLVIDTNKKSGDWDDLLINDDENEVEVVIEARGDHDGTGGVGTTETVMTITLARCLFEKGDTTIAKATLNKQPLEFSVLKPSTSDPTIEWAFTEE